jgi:hypothetical protein
MKGWALQRGEGEIEVDWTGPNVFETGGRSSESIGRHPVFRKGCEENGVLFMAVKDLQDESLTNESK